IRAILRRDMLRYDLFCVCCAWRFGEFGMSVTIAPERPDTEEAMALIAELEAVLSPGYPSESRHGLNVEQLLAQGVAFFVSRVDGLAAGCGGVRLYGSEYGELKRMYVRPQFRGLGLAKQMVEHLAA